MNFENNLLFQLFYHKKKKNKLFTSFILFLFDFILRNKHLFGTGLYNLNQKV